MSYSLSTYLVDLDTALGLIGSGDTRTRRAIGGRFKSELARADEWFASDIEDGAPTRYEALTAVVDGGPFDDKHAFQYGYAFEMIVQFYGRHLSNSNFSPFRGRWLERVDEGLAQLGVKAVSVTSFAYDGLPTPLPWAEMPGYGEWTAQDCATGLEQWAATTPEQRAALDPYVLEAVQECVTWMEAARAREGFGVAGFHC